GFRPRDIQSRKPQNAAKSLNPPALQGSNLRRRFQRATDKPGSKARHHEFSQARRRRSGTWKFAREWAAFAALPSAFTFELTHALKLRPIRDTGSAFLREPMQRLPQEGRGPLAVVNFVRLPFRCSRDLRLCLGECVLIQVLRQNSTAAFQRMSAIASVRDEMF